MTTIREKIALLRQLDAMKAERDAALLDARRYRHMRNCCGFRDRNGPGLYWYLPRQNWLNLGTAETLDADIDAAIAASISGSAIVPKISYDLL
jgi:hypothetical protein